MKYIIALLLIICTSDGIRIIPSNFVFPLTRLVSENFSPVKFTQNKYTYNIKRNENINLEEIRSVLVRYHTQQDWIDNVFGEIKLMAPNSKHITGLWTFTIKNNIPNDKNSAELSIVIVKAHVNNNDIIDIEIHLAEFVQDIHNVYDAVYRRGTISIIHWMYNYTKRNLNQNEIDLVKNRIFAEVKTQYNFNMLA
jgi:hypothetical protein